MAIQETGGRSHPEKKNFLKDVYSKEISGYEQFQQQGMGGYGQDSGYEPSADELIEVLK